MLPDRVSNPGPLTYESGALPTLKVALYCYCTIYSRLSLSRSRRGPLEYFEISVLRHIRCAELRKIPMVQPNFTNEHVI